MDTHDLSTAASPTLPRAEPMRDFASMVRVAAICGLTATLPSGLCSLQMFHEIIIDRSLPNLRKMLSQQPVQSLPTILRTPDASRDHATPFLLACLSGNRGICEYLLELGADIHAKSSRYGLPPRNRACLTLSATETPVQRQYSNTLFRSKWQLRHSAVATGRS